MLSTWGRGKNPMAALLFGEATVELKEERGEKD